MDEKSVMGSRKTIIRGRARRPSATAASAAQGSGGSLGLSNFLENAAKSNG
jgi:hypothetical protein